MGVARPTISTMSDSQYSGARIKFRCGEKDYDIKVKEEDASISIDQEVCYKDEDGIYYSLTRDNDGNDALRYCVLPESRAEMRLKAKIEDPRPLLLRTPRTVDVTIELAGSEILGHLKSVYSDGHIEVVARTLTKIRAFDLPAGWKRPKDWIPQMLMPLPSECGEWATG